MNAKKPSAEPEAKVTEEKKIEPVISGSVTRKKAPLGRRFLDTFVGGDAKSVAHYVLFDVIVPAAKDTIADVVSQGIERMLFGENRSSTRRGGYRPSGPSGFVQYNRFSQGAKKEPERMSRRARAQHDFDEILLDTRADAETVLDRMLDILSNYNQVTVHDLYGLVGVTPEHTDLKWGWTDLRGASIVRVQNRYLLDLPRTEPLE